MMRTLILAILMLAQQPKEGPKVFIDSVPYAPGVYTGASIVSAPEIASRFQAICPPCRVTIKKETADYVVMFAATQAQESGGHWSWAAFENKDGLLLSKGETVLFNNSIKDAANTIWAHWNHEDLPNPVYDFGACEKVTTCARIELTTLRTKERLDIIHAEGVQCLARAKNCVI